MELYVFLSSLLAFLAYCTFIVLRSPHSSSVGKANQDGSAITAMSVNEQTLNNDGFDFFLLTREISQNKRHALEITSTINYDKNNPYRYEAAFNNIDQLTQQFDFSEFQNLIDYKEKPKSERPKFSAQEKALIKMLSPYQMASRQLIDKVQEENVPITLKRFDEIEKLASALIDKIKRLEKAYSSF